MSSVNEAAVRLGNSRHRAAAISLSGIPWRCLKLALAMVFVFVIASVCGGKHRGSRRISEALIRTSTVQTDVIGALGSPESRYESWWDEQTSTRGASLIGRDWGHVFCIKRCGACGEIVVIVDESVARQSAVSNTARNRIVKLTKSSVAQPARDRGLTCQFTPPSCGEPFLPSLARLLARRLVPVRSH
jgi:hypothetical protein